MQCSATAPRSTLWLQLYAMPQNRPPMIHTRHDHHGIAAIPGHQHRSATARLARCSWSRRCGQRCHRPRAPVLSGSTRSGARGSATEPALSCLALEQARGTCARRTLGRWWCCGELRACAGVRRCRGHCPCCRDHRTLPLVLRRGPTGAPRLPTPSAYGTERGGGSRHVQSRARDRGPCE